MIGQDGRIAGLALGKMMTDKEFEAEAATLRLRLQRAKEDGLIEHPMHLGMIRTANAVVEEVTAIAEGRIPPTERRLSDPKGNAARIKHFYQASSDAEQRLSGGKTKLQFMGDPSGIMPLSDSVNKSPEIVPVDRPPKPR